MNRKDKNPTTNWFAYNNVNPKNKINGDCVIRAIANAMNKTWDEVKYDPEIKNIPQYRDAFKGSDYMPELVGFTEKKVDRWSRTCKKCGKVEYTKEQKAVKYEPNFN